MGWGDTKPFIVVTLLNLFPRRKVSGIVNQHVQAPAKSLVHLVGRCSHRVRRADVYTEGQDQSAKRAAVVSPMPREAPVMRTDLPRKSALAASMYGYVAWWRETKESTVGWCGGSDTVTFVILFYFFFCVARRIPDVGER